MGLVCVCVRTRPCMCMCVHVHAHAQELFVSTNDARGNERLHGDYPTAPGEMLTAKLEQIKWLSGLGVPCSNL